MKIAIRIVVTVAAAIAVVAALVLVPEDKDLPEQPVPEPGPPGISVYGSLATLRPTAMPDPAGDEAQLVAARGEIESFQISVSGGQDGVEALEFAVTEPLESGETAIPVESVAIYREVDYTVAHVEDGDDEDSFADRTVSDGEGALGPWPDALIPDRDALYGEERNAFPVDVAPGSRVSAWVDVAIPAETSPGRYAGSIDVKSGGDRIGSVPVSVEVFDFLVPRKSSLESLFAMSTDQVCVAHLGRECDRRREEDWNLIHLYARMSVANRISISNPYPGRSISPPSPGSEEKLFRRYVVPLLPEIGRLAAYGVSYGETEADPFDLGCGVDAACLDRWRELSERYGFEDRFMLYICDEPGDDGWRWDLCRSVAAQAATSSWPGVRTLITTWIGRAQAEEATDFLDTIAVVLPDLANREGAFLAGDQTPTYAEFLSSPGRELWLYTSCRASGCDDSTSEEWDGWAGYAIDQPASSSRATQWLAFLYGASGELYYDVSGTLPTAWGNQYQFGANGDGNLFYPGIPEGVSGEGEGDAPPIGGTTHIPIESIRLKRIRDGYEDYELLRGLERIGAGRLAQRLAAGLLDDGNSATTPRDAATFSTVWTQEEMDSARQRMRAAFSDGDGQS